jgi:hypothetical protein
MSVHFTCKPSPSVSPRQARLAPNRAPDTLNNALLTLKVLVLSSEMDLAESGFVYLYFLESFKILCHLVQLLAFSRGINDSAKRGWWPSLEEWVAKSRGMVGLVKKDGSSSQEG